MMLFSKTCVISVHQKAVLFGKCEFCWKVPAICRRKHDHLAARTV